MQAVNYSVATSLDGFIAREDGALDCFLMEGDHVADYLEALRSFDAVLMGRRTYDLGAKLGVTDPYPFLETYVVSQAMTSAPSPRVTVIGGDVAGTVRALRAREGRGIYLCGGGALAGVLFAEGLVDELTIKLNPALIGSGIPVVRGLQRDVALELLECKAYASGVVLLRYRVRPPSKPHRQPRLA